MLLFATNIEKLKLTQTKIRPPFSSLLKMVYNHNLNNP